MRSASFILHGSTFAGAVAFLLAAAAILAPEAVATNGSRPIASGARAGGRGGADVGIADDATAINTNPAGIGFFDGQRLDATAALVLPEIAFSSVDAGESDRKLLYAATFGAAFDFEEPWRPGEALSFADESAPILPPRRDPAYDGVGLKFGLGMFILKANQLTLEATTPFFDEDPTAGLPRQPQIWRYDGKDLLFTAAVAWRATPRLSFGLAPSFIWGELNAQQPLAQPVSVLQGHPLGQEGITYADAAPFLGLQQIECISKIIRARTYGFRIRAGALFEPLDWLSVGLAYASPTLKQDYLGKVRVDFSRQIQKLDPSRSFLEPIILANLAGQVPPDYRPTYIGEYDLRILAVQEPHEVTVGIGLAFGRVTIGLDLGWLNWSGTYKDFRGRLTNGTSPELNELTGDGSGSVKTSVPLDWEDQVVVALGLAFSPIDGLVLRAGYNFGRNPIPSDTLQPTTPAIFEHHVTGGLSVHVKRFEISLSVEHDFRVSERVQSSRVNLDLEGSEVEAAVTMLALGFGIRF